VVIKHVVHVHTVKMSEQAKSTIGYLSNNWASYFIKLHRNNSKFLVTVWLRGSSGNALVSIYVVRGKYLDGRPSADG